MPTKLAKPMKHTYPTILTVLTIIAKNLLYDPISLTNCTDPTYPTDPTGHADPTDPTNPTDTTDPPDHTDPTHPPGFTRNGSLRP
jgi:hypothetical protein